MIYKGYNITSHNGSYNNGVHAAMVSSINYNFTCFFDKFTDAIEFVRIVNKQMERKGKK